MLRYCSCNQSLPSGPASAGRRNMNTAQLLAAITNSHQRAAHRRCQTPA